MTKIKIEIKMDTESINFNELPKWEQLIVVSNAEIITSEIIESFNSGFYQNSPLSSYQINTFKFYKKMYELAHRYDIEWTYLFNDVLSLSQIYANFMIKLKKRSTYEDDIENITIIKVINMAFDQKLPLIQNHYLRVFYVSHSFNNNL
jgi:hypothetical protein